MWTTGGSISGNSEGCQRPLTHGWSSQGIFRMSIDPRVVPFLDLPGGSTSNLSNARASRIGYARAH
jgi:hypothetical protein